MKVTYLLIAAYLLLSGCTNTEYVTEEVDNPSFIPNVEFQGFEDLTNPGFQHIIEKYQLDTIFHGETDEFQRILLLRHWIKSVIKIDDHGEPYPGGNSTEGILDAALQGHGFHCGHFMVVQNGIMNAYGYGTRTLGAGPGVEGGPDGHHGINEIWLNDYNKWFLSDAKYDHHFEKDGIPLSALEVRDEYLKNRAADIVKVKGPERIPTDIDPETGTIRLDAAKCDGCAWCIDACDFGAISMNHEAKLVEICDQCENEPEGPQCVLWCPKEALSLTTPEKRAQKSRRELIKQEIIEPK